MLKEGKFQKLVDEVEHVTFSGVKGVENNQQVLYVTERCVMQLTTSGLEVIEIAPGIDIECDVLAQAGFALNIADDLKLMDKALFCEQPFGLDLSVKGSV